MANFGGFGGGNMQALMKQAQKLQSEALKAQEEVEASEIEGLASGGLVKVVINGKNEVLEVSIDPDIVDPEDVEMLEDLIMVALNDANDKLAALKSQKMGKFGGIM